MLYGGFIGELWHWTRDGELSGSTPDHFTGQLFTHVLLSPSSIIWYWPKGDDTLWLRN